MEELVICNNCQVRYEAKKDRCPICNNIGNKGLESSFHSSLVQEKSWKGIILVFVALALLIPCIIMLILDWSQDNVISWSRLVILSLVVSWVYFACLLLYYNEPFLVGILLLIITILFLYLFNIIQKSNWFVSFGLPLSIGIFIISTITFLVIKHSKRQGLNTVAYFLFGVLIILVFIEGLYSLYIYDEIILQWSLLVLGGLLPFVFGLFYLDKHRNNLLRWFHY